MRWWRLVCVLGGLGLLSGPVLAEQFDLIPFVEIGVAYDDNIFFDAADETDDVMTSVAPGFELVKRTERLALSTQARAKLLFYAQNDELNDVDQTYAGELAYRLSQKWRVAGDALFLRDSRADRDLEDTGLVQNSEQREHQKYGVATDYQLNEKILVTAAYGYARDEFEDDIDFSDYTAHTASVGVSYNLSETFPETVGRLRFGFDRYEYESSLINNYAFTAGFEKRLTERLSLSADAGGRYTYSEFDANRLTEISPGRFVVVPDAGEDEQWGGLGSVALICRGERWTTRLSVSHDIEAASGRTGSVERTAVGLALARKISTTFTAGVSARYFINQGDRDELAGSDIDESTLRLHPYLRWELHRYLALDGAYTYTFAEDHAADTDSTQNRVTLVLQCRYPVFGNVPAFH